MDRVLDFVKFSEADLARLEIPPSQCEALATQGIPADLFGRFIAVSAPVTTSSVRGQLVVLGTAGFKDKVCLDPISGEVVEMVDTNEPPTFVNDSLGAFVRTAQVVFSLFPFHSRGADVEERDRSATMVAAHIRRIDPSAMLPDRFWSALVDDITVGDFDQDVMEFLDES